MSLTVKKGDNVVVLAGKEKGAIGKVLAVDPQSGRVKVENVNMVSRHRKARSAQDTGGISKMEGNIDISNVQVICPVCNKATRIGAMMQKDKKVRKCGKCGAALDVKAEKAKKTTAKAGDTKAEKPKKTVKKEDTAAKPKKTASKSTAKTSAAPKTAPAAENEQTAPVKGEN